MLTLSQTACWRQRRTKTKYW